MDASTLAKLRVCALNDVEISNCLVLELTDDIVELQQQLKEARDILGFYADVGNFACMLEHDEQWSESDDASLVEVYGQDSHGDMGIKAEEYLQKYGGQVIEKDKADDQR